MLRRLLRRPEVHRPVQRELPAPFTALGEAPGADYRGTPTYVCPCGYDMFLIATRFDETQLPAFYLLDGVCAACGSLVTVPCPADGPDPFEGDVHA